MNLRALIEPLARKILQIRMIEDERTQRVASPNDTTGASNRAPLNAGAPLLSCLTVRSA